MFVALGATRVLQREEAYVWDYCDASVLLASRTALACIREDSALACVKRLEADMDEDERTVLMVSDLLK